LPRLLLSFCNSLTSHIKQFSGAELLACLQLVSKIFSHIQSPVTRVASSSTSDVARSLGGRVVDELETAEKPSVNMLDVKVVEGDVFVATDRYSVAQFSHVLILCSADVCCAVFDWLDMPDSVKCKHDDT